MLPQQMGADMHRRDERANEELIVGGQLLFPLNLLRAQPAELTFQPRKTMLNGEVARAVREVKGVHVLLMKDILGGSPGW